MPRFTITRQISAPKAKVFDQISDFANAPKRVSGIKRVEMLTNGSVGKGTRFRETRIMFNREATEEMEVMAFDPPNGYVLGGESCGCRYRSEFALSESGSGTEVRMSFDAKPITVFAKIVSVLTRPMLKFCVRACEKDLDDIKRSIEAGG